MKAIPTKLNGVTYRSKSEARLAVCFFDWGWKFKYEPKFPSMPKFNPDFLIAHEDDRFRVIEYKPVLPLRKYIRELERKFSTLIKNNWDVRDKVRCELWCVDFYNKHHEFLRFENDTSRLVRVKMDIPEGKGFNVGCDFRFDLSDQTLPRVDISSIC